MIKNINGGKNTTNSAIRHVLVGGCKAGWEDLWRITYLLRFLTLAGGCLLMILLPLVLTFLMVNSFLTAENENEEFF